MSDAAAKRLLSGRAWDDFCDQLRAAGHMIERFGDSPDPLDKAEWYRFMTRLLRNGCERFMENCEPARPRLRDAPWRQSINFQSPDQDHLLAEFQDGSASYRITGHRGGIPYFVMAAWEAPQPDDIGAEDWGPQGDAGLKRFNPALLRTTGFLQSDSIPFDADGNFTVTVSQTRPADGSAWLPITPKCVGVLVRTVFHDRAREQAPVMRIERLDPQPQRPVRPDEVAEGLAKSGQLVLSYAELVRSWWQDNLGKRPNRIRFSMATYLSNGGVPDRHHGFGTWEKAIDEALVMRFTPTPCDYWILQLCNMWQENLDNYEDGQGHITKYKAAFEPDGSVLAVIAESDPGIGGNWIDSFGHVHGGMSLRLIKTQGEPPAVTVHRVPLAQLKAEGRACLTDETAIVSGEITD